jgi:hypothetical protein
MSIGMVMTSPGPPTTRGGSNNSLRRRHRQSGVWHSGYFAAYIKGAAKLFDEIEDSQTATILNIAVERTSSMNEAIAIKAHRSLS